ncbi:MAG: MFS transporter [Spirochaetales bacterium]|nr:MFS transporter [Spirochaetales bacterium]
MSIVLTGIAFGLIFLLSDRFIFSAGKIGFYLAIGYAAYMAGLSIFRRVEDRIDVRFCLPVAAMVITGASVTIYLSHTAGVTALAWGILQGMTAFYWPPLMGWISSGLEGKELNRDLGRFNQSWSIGALFGPFITGVLYSRNPNFAFMIFILSFAVLSLFLLLSILFIREMRSWKPVPSVPIKSIKIHKNKSTEIPEKGSFLRYPSWVGIFCAYAFLGVVINILPLEIRNNLGYSEQTAGNLLFIRGFASLVSFTILGKTILWHNNRRWILFVQAAIILIPLLLLPIRAPLLFYIMTLVLMGLLFSANYSNSIFHGSSGIENKSGRMAIHEGMLTAGAVTGTFGGGNVYQHWGIAGIVIFLICLTFSGFMISSFMIIGHRKRSRVRLKS